MFDIMTIAAPAGLDIPIKTHNIMHLKLVNFIVCKSYLNKIDIHIPKRGGKLQNHYFIR